MKALYPLLAFFLIAAGPCGVPERASSGPYGYGPGPRPNETVASDGRTITVRQALGDRMFTAIESIYDARTLTLLSSKRRASCCMMYWESSTSRNADGTYDVHAVESMPSPRGDDDYNESRPHLYVQPNVPVIVGGLFFVPWIWHVTDARQIVRLLFDPLRIEYFSIAQTSPQPFPEGVPKSDKALEVKSFRQTTATTLWYDPCTFTLDAYGSRAGNIMVRYASQH